MPEQKPRYFCGKISAFITNGMVKRPNVELNTYTSSKIVGNAAGIHSYCSTKLNFLLITKPYMHIAITMDEYMVGGRRPKWSNNNPIIVPATTRTIPIYTTHKNGSIVIPTSVANFAAYTTTTNIPDNCWNAKNPIIINVGRYTSGLNKFSIKRSFFIACRLSLCIIKISISPCNSGLIKLPAWSKNKIENFQSNICVTYLK